MTQFQLVERLPLSLNEKHSTGHFHLPNEFIHATSASQLMPMEAILKLPYADRSKNSTNDRNRDGAKQELKSKEITYYQKKRCLNKFYKGSLIQVNLSPVARIIFYIAIRNFSWFYFFQKTNLSLVQQWLSIFLQEHRRSVKEIYWSLFWDIKLTYMFSSPKLWTPGCCLLGRQS